MSVLLAWLGVMVLAAAGVSGLLVGRFPEAFTSRDGRRLRPLVAAGLVLAGMTALVGLSFLVLTAIISR